jgi:hypothetical protein
MKNRIFLFLSCLFLVGFSCFATVQKEETPTQDYGLTSVEDGFGLQGDVFIADTEKVAIRDKLCYGLESYNYNVNPSESIAGQPPTTKADFKVGWRGLVATGYNTITLYASSEPAFSNERPETSTNQRNRRYFLRC